MTYNGFALILAEWTGLTGHFAKPLILRSFFETTV